MERPLAEQEEDKMVDVPTNATWAPWLPGTTSGGKEKETDLELLCFTGAISRNRVFEEDCSTPSGCGNMEVIHCRINCMPRSISTFFLLGHHILMDGYDPMFPSNHTFMSTVQTRLSEAP